MAGLSCPMAALAQGVPVQRASLLTLGPVLMKPETGLRLSSLLGMRSIALVRDSLPDQDAMGAGLPTPATLQSLGASLDLYPLGGSLRFSAGVIRSSADALASQANTRNFKLSDTTMPTLTLGYGRSLQGPVNITVDGGVMLRDMPRPGDAAAPRLTGNFGVSRAYPMARLLVSRAF